MAEHDLKDEAIPRLETPRYYRWWKVEDLYKGLAAPQKVFPYNAHPTTGRPFYFDLARLDTAWKVKVVPYYVIPRASDVFPHKAIASLASVFDELRPVRAPTSA
jgi:hypothetical protein